MRIVIDMQPTQNASRLRGIGRYSLSLTTELATLAIARGHEINLLVSNRFPKAIPPLIERFSGLVPAENFKIFDVPSFAVLGTITGNLIPVKAGEIIRENFIASLRPDFVHINSLFEGADDDSVVSIGRGSKTFPTSSILYDMIPHVLSDTYITTRAFADYYDNKIASLKEARLLLAISDQSRLDAIERIGIAPERIVNVSAGVDPQFRPIEVSVEDKLTLLGRLGIMKPFILYVPGGFDPRKNFENLIKAYAVLPDAIRSNFQLVIASSSNLETQTWLRSLVKKAAVDPASLVLTGYVVDDDLVTLYNLADLHVFPSLYEGFGLPALESMACGTPTIGSNTSCLPEVLGSPDALFDPLSIDSIAAKMVEALSDGQYRKSLSEHGVKHAQTFTWKRSAAIAMDMIEHAHADAKVKAHLPVVGHEAASI